MKTPDPLLGSDAGLSSMKPPASIKTSARGRAVSMINAEKPKTSIFGIQGTSAYELNEKLAKLIDPKHFTKKEMNEFTWDKKKLEEIQVSKLTPKQWLEGLIFTDLQFCSKELFKTAIK